MVGQRLLDCDNSVLVIAYAEGDLGFSSAGVPGGTRHARMVSGEPIALQPAAMPPRPASTKPARLVMATRDRGAAAHSMPDSDG